MGLGSAYHFKAKYYLDQWLKGKPPTELSYKDAKQAGETSLQYEPTQSYYQSTQGHVLEWGRKSQLDNVYNDEVINLYERSISSRPAWSQTYASQAHQYAFFKQNLEQAWSHIRLGLEFGPYTWQVLNQAVMIGLAYWPNLNLEQKQLVFNSAEKLVMFNHTRISQLLKAIHFYKKEALFCTYFKFSKQPEDNKRREYLLKRLCK
ncbi:hypothetical protein PA25_26040 [Pseudoalteromonas sp. A25]|uniref:hypothetical protein n=1 Tax=Pseudoalteromonas sp. A25 TaxID=116092 RepID=UPI001260BBFA|nr:hypothetical protein [Pseudoalteromonas sp. A25]BBN82619.1 hypothetical protein PA25_26040 [Pseudoalteromonas sp. A25]